MKFCVLFPLLITMISGQEDWTKIWEVPAEQTETNLKNMSSSKSSSEAIRDLGSLQVLIKWQSELKRMCSINNSSENHHIYYKATKEFDVCKNGLVNLWPGLPWLTDVTNSYANSLCSYYSEANSCLLKYTESLKPCLPIYRGGNFPFSNISQALFNYLCDENGAEDSFKSFLENAATCMSELNRASRCESYRPHLELEQNTYLFSEDTCGNIIENWECLIKEIPKCPDSVTNFMIDLGKAVAQVHSPCPVDRAI